MIEQGQIVFSKCGRDKGHLFLVLSVDGEYLYLADGGLRPLKKPKKKKAKHVQITNEISETVREKLKSQSHLMDSDIRKALSACDGFEVGR